MPHTITRGRRRFSVDEDPAYTHANAPIGMWGPTIRLIQNGSSKRMVECLVCGANHSWCAKWPTPQHAYQWIAEHQHDHEELNS